MRAALFTITLLLVGTAAAATVYRWVDDQGVVHYSDQPHPGAEKVHLQAAQGFQASSSSSSAAVTNAPSPARGGGLTCEIDNPTNEQMLMNEHSMSGHVSVQPDPGPGAQLTVLVDGKQVAADGGSFSVDPIDRGQHTITATVTSSAGQTLCQAQPVTFYVHQPSKQAPNPVNRPTF